MVILSQLDISPTVLGPEVGGIAGGDLWQPYIADIKIFRWKVGGELHAGEIGLTLHGSDNQHWQGWKGGNQNYGRYDIVRQEACGIA